MRYSYFTLFYYSDLMSEGYSVLIENWDKPVVTWLRRIPTLFIPFFLAFICLMATASVFLDPSHGEEVGKVNDEPSRLFVGGAFGLIILPVFIALSWGMLFAIKQVSSHLEKLSHTRKTGFATVIGSWVSALSKAHLYITLFYALIAITLIVGANIFSPDNVNAQIVEQFGIPGRSGVAIVFSIGALAYVLIFSLMGYVMGTLPLALITACLFRVFSLNRLQFRAGEITPRRTRKVSRARISKPAL